MLLLCLVVGLSSALAVSIDITTLSTTSGDISVVCAKGTGQSKPSESSGTFVRLYTNNTVTITSSDKNIVSMTIGWSKNTSKDYATATSNTGTYTDAAANGSQVVYGQWTGSAKEIVFTIGTGQKQLHSIELTLEGSSSTDKKEFNPFTQESYTLTAGATGNISEFLNTTPTDYNGTITYGSNDDDVIVIDTDGSYLVGDEGTTTIYATANATSTYEAIYKVVTITIGGGDDPDTPTSENLVVTYNFNDKDAYPEGFPKKEGNSTPTTTAERQTFSISGNDIIINAPNNYYITNYGTDASRGLFFGKSVASNGIPSDGTAYLGFPAKNGYKLVKVEVVTTSTTGKNNLNVFDTSWNEMSTAIQAPTSKEATYIFELSNSTSNTEYRLTTKNSGNNMQFKTVSITYEPVSSPEQPTTGTITFNSKATNNEQDYWATFSSNRAVMIEDAFVVGDEYLAAICVYSVTTDGDKLEYNELEKTGDYDNYYVIPENTGVLLKYSLRDDKTFTNGEVSFEYVANTNTTISNNLMKPASETMSADNYNYKLTTKNGANVGFYFGAEDGAPFEGLREGTAYLAIPKSATSAKSFVLNDIETAITFVSSELDGNAPIYNIAGQRVNSNAKGILIQNGKKFINK